MSSLHLASDLPSPMTASLSSASWLAQARFTVQTWLARDRSRRVLAEMDELALKDIGLSRGDAVVESGKPFWER